MIAPIQVSGNYPVFTSRANNHNNYLAKVHSIQGLIINIPHTRGYVMKHKINGECKRAQSLQK